MWTWCPKYCLSFCCLWGRESRAIVNKEEEEVHKRTHYSMQYIRTESHISPCHRDSALQGEEVNPTTINGFWLHRYTWRWLLFRWIYLLCFVPCPVPVQCTLFLSIWWWLVLLLLLLHLLMQYWCIHSAVPFCVNVIHKLFQGPTRTIVPGQHLFKSTTVAGKFPLIVLG